MTEDQRRIGDMPRTWVQTYPDAVLHRREYKAKLGDRHYGATSPLPALTCRCEPRSLSDGDCWKCGKPADRNPDNPEES